MASKSPERARWAPRGVLPWPPQGPTLSYVPTAIISDLHGNWPALSVAIPDAIERGAQRFVCLGDVVGYGAKPRQCLQRVMDLISGEEDGLSAGLCLQGNHEYALLNSAEDFNPNARAAIDWTRDSIGRDVERDKAYVYWDFLSELEPLRREHHVMYAHGSPRDPVREYLLPRDIRDEGKMKALFACMDPGQVCFVGHSHVPAIYYEDGRFYRPKTTEGPYDLGDLSEARAIVNVGSVGQPRDGDRRLSYVLFDGQNVTFVRLEYDIEAAQSEIRSIPELPDYLADRLAIGH